MEDFNIHKVSGFELVATQQDFQSIEAINTVFQHIIIDRTGSFWSKVLKVRVLVKEGENEQRFEFIPEQLKSLKRTFILRHEVVHDPIDGKEYLTGAVINDIIHSAWMIFGSEPLISQFINDNLSPQFKKGTKPAQGIVLKQWSPSDP